MVSALLLSELLLLKESGEMTPFYAKNVWRQMAGFVRNFDRNECQICKKRGKYSRGFIVHHIKHLEDRPDLALSLFDEATGERQLITLCKKCHEEQHQAEFSTAQTKEPTTLERWD